MGELEQAIRDQPRRGRSVNERRDRTPKVRYFFSPVNYLDEVVADLPTPNRPSRNSTTTLTRSSSRPSKKCCASGTMTWSDPWTFRICFLRSYAPTCVISQ